MSMCRRMRESLGLEGTGHFQGKGPGGPAVMVIDHPLDNRYVSLFRTF